METRLFLAQLMMRFRAIGTRYYYLAIQESIVGSAKAKLQASIITVMISVCVLVADIYAIRNGAVEGIMAPVLLTGVICALLYVIHMAFSDKKAYNNSRNKFLKLLNGLKNEADAGADAILYFFDGKGYVSGKNIAKTKEMKK